MKEPSSTRAHTIYDKWWFRLKERPCLFTGLISLCIFWKLNTKLT